MHIDGMLKSRLYLKKNHQSFDQLKQDKSSGEHNRDRPSSRLCVPLASVPVTYDPFCENGSHVESGKTTPVNTAPLPMPTTTKGFG